MVVIQAQLLNLVIDRINSVDLANVSEVQLDNFRFEAITTLWTGCFVLLLRVVPRKQF